MPMVDLAPIVLVTGFGGVSREASLWFQNEALPQFTLANFGLSAQVAICIIQAIGKAAQQLKRKETPTQLGLVRLSKLVCFVPVLTWCMYTAHGVLTEQGYSGWSTTSDTSFFPCCPSSVQARSTK